MKIRNQLAGLVLGLAIPFLLVTAILVVLLVERERSAVERGLQDTVRALGTAFDREIAASIDVLETLAASRRLSERDLRAFRGDLAGIPRLGKHWRLIRLMNADGQVLLDTAVPPTGKTALPSVAERQWFRQLKQTRAPVVSPVLIRGRTSDRLGIPVAVPVMRNGEMRYGLALFYDAIYLSRVFADQRLEPGWTAIVLDQANTVIARSSAPEKFVGTSAAADLAEGIGAADAGRFTAQNLQGDRSFGFYVRSPLSGWVVALAAPEQVLLDVGHFVWAIAAGGTLLLALALGVAGLFERRIARAVRSLAETARALGRGEALPAVPALRVRELHELGGELASAAALLQQRQQERDTAEERLRRSEALHRGVIDLVREVIWIHQNGKFVFANPYAARVMGFSSPEDLMGLEALSFIHPADLPRAEARTKLLQAGTALTGTEMRLVRRDGQVIVMEMLAISFEFEGKASVLAVGRDITQRIEAADALRDSEARFRDFAEIASDWLWEMGPDLRFTYVSPRVEELTGVPAIQSIGKTRDEVWGKVMDDPEVMQAHVEALRTRRPFRNFAFAWTAPDGGVRHITISGKPVFDETGTFQGYRGVGSDVTAALAAESQLRQAQKMEALGQLTGGVAHDFNNLLLVVIGNAELVLERLDPANAPLRMLVGQIEEAGLRGAALTQRLLAFSRRQSLTPQRIDMNDLVRSIEPLLRRTLGESIEITSVLADKVWATVADAGQLENSLINLALNARDAMPKGGRLIIETANVRLDESDALLAGELQPGAPGAYVMLSVSDTGIGIPPEAHPHVFEPFYTTKEVGKGTGLGLSMVYGFVKQSGGYVALDSEVGAGTTVKIYLPRLEESGGDAAEEEEEEPAAVGGGTETMLLVEDDPDVRNVVLKMLGRLGYRAAEASDGKAALALLRGGIAVDLVLTDVVMPGGVDGWDLAQILWRERPGLRILFMTGYTDNAILQRANMDSRVRVLSKPFRQRDLAAAMRAALDDEQP
jgi:PAS domain S-box-containing protein